MAVTLLQIVLAISGFWVILSFISTKYNLIEKGLIVGPGILLWRTERLNKFYEGVATRIKRFDHLSKYVVFFILVLFFTLPIILLINLIYGLSGFPSPILVDNPLQFFTLESFVLIIPPLIIALSIHEILHGIGFNFEKVEIKQTGIAVVGFFFTTFVEKSSVSYNKLRDFNKMKILTIAVFGNLLLALLFVPVLHYSDTLMSPMYEESSGSLIIFVEEGYPGIDAGMEKGDIITGVKIVQYQFVVRSINITSSNEMIAALRNIPVGDQFLITINGKDELIKGVRPPSGSIQLSGSYLGLRTTDYREPKAGFMSIYIPYWFDLELKWFININLGIGLFNLLPLPFTDGKDIFQILTNKSSFYGRNRDKLNKIVYGLAGILLLTNLVFTIF
jgi:hypothetical protein